MLLTRAFQFGLKKVSIRFDLNRQSDKYAASTLIIIIIIIIIKGIYIAQVRKGHKCAMSAEIAVWLRNCLYPRTFENQLHPITLAESIAAGARPALSISI